MTTRNFLNEKKKKKSFLQKIKVEKGGTTKTGKIYIFNFSKKKTLLYLKKNLGFFEISLSTATSCAKE